MMESIAEHDILVIGAGPAGVTSAYYLQQQHLSYRVVDRSRVPGDTWQRLYPSLQLNTSRMYSHLPGKPFPRSWGMFPTGQQYHQHLVEFVEEHDLHMDLGIEVYRVAPQGDWWRVESSEGTLLYRAVISATGIFGKPITPHIEGMDAFAGAIIHAHDFSGPEMVTDKRVLVVGNGPSGVDISVAASQTARSTHIAIRSGVKLKRRYPLGIPTHGWLLLGEHLPDPWCRWIMKQVGKFGFPDQEKHGLHAAPPGEGGMTAYQGPELLDAVKAGKVHPVPGPTRFEADGVIFADGQHRPFDVVVMATGYEPVLHQYLDIEMQFNPDPWQAPSPCDWQIGPNGQRGWPLRDTSEHPNGRQVLGYPGLYLVGTFYKGKGAMFNFKVEGEIAARQIKDYLATSAPQRSPEAVAVGAADG